MTMVDSNSSASPGQILRIARGFSCLFWSLPFISAAHALALGGLVPERWMLAGLPASFLPLACGLWMLRAAGEPVPRWRVRVGRVALVALLVAWLSPFLLWWTAVPLRYYFAANAGAHYLLLIVLLAGLNRLAADFAQILNDTALRREALAGLWMVLWLSACTVGALVWLFQRAGLLAAGLPAVLAELAALPREAQTLFMLPYAMTAYTMWRAKETGFRNAGNREI